MNDNVLVQEGDLRVRLVRDDYPEMPYDDGGSPIVRVEKARGRVSQVEEITSYQVSDAALTILRDYADGDLDWDEMVALLRRDVGATRAEVISHPADYRSEYVTFDPADWREKVGAPEGSVSLADWEAYLDGEVYGYVIEERVIWKRTDSDGTVIQERETWEHVDSCFGHYGARYAEEAAREAFADHVREAGAA
jgi:hypothetical protein